MKQVLRRPVIALNPGTMEPRVDDGWPQAHRIGGGKP